MPTTQSGGTSEIEIATPGSVSAMSRRISAIDPTAPVAMAPIRSGSPGLTRAATCEFVAATTSLGTNQASTSPIATTTTAAVVTMATDRSRFARSPSTDASIVPWMGIISGATIMAPITVAVESERMPVLAMTAANVNKIQNRVRRRGASGPSKQTASRMNPTCSAATLATATLDQPFEGHPDPMPVER